MPGVYGGFVDKIPLGAFMNKALTLKTGQTHMMRYMKPLLERVNRRDRSAVSSSATCCPSMKPRRIQDIPRQTGECTKVVLDPWTESKAA